MILSFTYATPSVFESTRDAALLGLSADAGRPVRFHATVERNVLSVRMALQALGQVVWSNDEWRSEADFFWTLDPIITVHPDRVFFEAFSQDQSAYGLVIVDRDNFTPEGDVQTGTTNVDFTTWLWSALAEMRSSRRTRFRIGAEGFEVSTASAGGRFEQKVEVPDDWVRGFLQLQAGMALPGTRLSVRPVDLLSAIRFLRFTKARVSPRALRFELEPDQDAALLLEPWEHRVPLVGAAHGYAEKRVIRTWGRRRLSLLEPLLPFAERVDIYLKGRALPAFYAVKLPGVTFVLGLSGWTSNRWSGSGGFELLASPLDNPGLRQAALRCLAQRYALSTEEVAAALGVEKPEAARALTALCAEGRAIFDVEARTWRHRELFREPADLERLYPPDPRRVEAERLEPAVRVASCAPRETRKVKRLKTPEGPITREVVHRDWVVLGAVGGQPAVEVVLNDEQRLIFGRCGCDFFQDHLLNQGPCAHMLALLKVSEPLRKDTSTSKAASAEALALAPKPVSEDRDADGGDDDSLDDEEGDDDNS
jgi:hypothetical protein